MRVDLVILLYRYHFSLNLYQQLETRVGCKLYFDNKGYNNEKPLLLEHDLFFVWHGGQLDGTSQF